jgi:hypothetical protein
LNFRPFFFASPLVIKFRICKMNYDAVFSWCFMMLYNED